jgi:thymidylate synthase (FAD)
MEIIKPKYEIITDIDSANMLKSIEKAGRTCYKSEDRITENSSEKFVAMLIKRGHHAMIEHAPSLSIRFIFDRGVSHEIVRHRLCSFAQESTRYVDYTKEKHGSGEINFIEIFPHLKNEESYQVWKSALQNAEDSYKKLRELGEDAQIARSVLPNSLKTEIVVTANLRQWRLIFSLRADRPAHPQMREIMIPLLEDLKKRIPVVFDDIEY